MKRLLRLVQSVFTKKGKLTMPTPAIAPASYVKYLGEKRFLIGYSPKGKAVLLVPKVSGQPSKPDQYVDPASITPWVEPVAAAPLSVTRYFNVYEGDRVGTLVRTLAETEINAGNSVRERVGVAKIVLVRNASGFAVSGEVSAA